MISLKTDIVNKKTIISQIIARNYLDIIFLLLIIIFIYLKVDKNASYIVLVLFILVIGYTFKKKMIASYNKIGRIEINQNEIIILINNQTNSFLLSDIRDLKIYYFGYSGYRIGRRTSEGDENYLTFIDKYEKKQKFDFYLNSIEEKERLKELFGHWYKERFKFKEYEFGKVRSFMFKSNLSYSEIQEIKEKYNIDWI
jgi:hypothetical protein